jgi:hypothetical protein
MHGYKAGDKAKTGKPIDLGLSEHSKLEGGNSRELRGETGSSQPTLKKGSMSSDRGTFPTES